MPSRGEGPAPPTARTVEALRSGVEVLSRVHAFAVGGSTAPPPNAGPSPAEDPSELLRRCESGLHILHEELDGLEPWFLTFVGSSLVVNLAVKAVVEPLDEIHLHLDQMHEPPGQVLRVIGGACGLAAQRVGAVIDLLPGHLRLAKRMSARERGFLVRLRALPTKLRHRVYLGMVFGCLFLTSVAIAFLALLVPRVGNALGVSGLLSKYASTDAGIVVVALIFFSGARLLIGAIYLTRTISILPTYEERRLDAARAGIQRREVEVLDRISPTEPAVGEILDGVVSPAAGKSPRSELGKDHAQGPGVVDQQVDQRVAEDAEPVEER